MSAELPIFGEVPPKTFAVKQMLNDAKREMDGYLEKIAKVMGVHVEELKKTNLIGLRKAVLNHYKEKRNTKVISYYERFISLAGVIEGLMYFE